MPIYSSPAIPRDYGKQSAPSHKRAPAYPKLPHSSDPSIPIPLPTLAPLPCDVLDRRRTGTFGPIDPRPRGSTPSERLSDATHGQWLLHRHGQDLPIRPVNLVAPQSLYSGCEYLENKQEVHKLTVINARLLVHNPQSGLPTIRTGHAEVEFFAAPSDGTPWPFETPYAPDRKTAHVLQKYGPKLRHEVSLHRRKGEFRLTLSRQIIKDNRTPTDATSSWRSQPAIHAPEPRRPAIASSAIHLLPPTPAPTVVDASNASHGYRFLLNPEDQPPTKVADWLPKLGRATNGDSVYVVNPRDEDAPRIDTPGLPLQLVESMPPMASINPQPPAASFAPQTVLPVAPPPSGLVPQPASVVVESPAPLSPIDEEDMEVSDDESPMEDVAATPPPLLITSAREISPSNEVRERLNYDARKFFQTHPDDASKTALVFGAFVHPTPTTPVVSTPNAHAMADVSEEERQAAALARSEFAKSAEGHALTANVMRALSPLASFPHLRRLESESAGAHDAEAHSAERAQAAESDEDAAGSSDEEGEIRPLSTSVLHASHVERVPIPVLGNGKRGPLVTREKFSSSPSFQSMSSGDLDSDGKTQIPSGWEILCSPPENVADNLEKTKQRARTWYEDYSDVRKSLKCKLTISSQEDQSDRSSTTPPALVNISSDSEEDAPGPYVAEPRNNVKTNDKYRQVILGPRVALLSTHQLEQALSRQTNLLHAAPPAFVIEEGAHDRVVNETQTWAADLEAATLSRRVEREVFVAQPLHEFVEVVLAHPDLLLDRMAMNHGRDLVNLEEFYKEMREFLNSEGDATRWVSPSPLRSGSIDTYESSQTFTREELNSIAIPRHDGMQQLVEGRVFPRGPGGKPFRPLTYMGGVAIQVSRNLDFVSCLTVLHACLNDYTTRGLDVIQEFGWRLETSCIAAATSIPFPFADGQLNMRFRVVNATMRLNGRATLAELGDALGRLCFRDPELISHFLHSNMLRPIDAEEVVSNESAVSSPRGIQASFNFTCPLPSPEPQPLQNERHEGPMRVMGTWASFPTPPVHTDFTVARGYMGIPRPQTPEPSYFRAASSSTPPSFRRHSRTPTPEPAHPGYHLVDRFVRWTPPVAKTASPISRTRSPRHANLRGQANASL
ncbi:hypothetical protein C8R47DRAFT_1085246 [Mycena vitilis]|nr:hypothetical protein C8R47DRAFT_1085246 [Mycena vitilis]